jgi:hypothetical protein
VQLTINAKLGSAAAASGMSKDAVNDLALDKIAAEPVLGFLTNPAGCCRAGGKGGCRFGNGFVERAIAWLTPQPLVAMVR